MNKPESENDPRDLHLSAHQSYTRPNRMINIETMNGDWVKLTTEYGEEKAIAR